MATPRSHHTRVLIESVRMEGFLTKQGHNFKTWKRRWCVLKGDGLRYYKSIKHSRPQGIIPLRGIGVVKAPSSLKKELAFQVNCTDPEKPIYYFLADSAAERDRWMAAIKEMGDQVKRHARRRGASKSPKKTRNSISLTIGEIGQMALKYPGQKDLSLKWVKTFINRMQEHGADAEHLQHILSEKDVKAMLKDGKAVLGAGPNVNEINMQPGVTLTLCGDIHGQFYDLYNIFKINGLPTENHWYSWNGDYVDRGSWGIECFLTLLAFKILYPDYVFMCRGNHETRECSMSYGFADEVEHKYHAALYENFMEVFHALPVASLVNPAPKYKRRGSILAMHGGLFRKNEHEIGTVALMNTWNRRAEPDQGSALDDMLWSDPYMESGFEYNASRDCGIVFGPDVTMDFLAKNNLSLIVRSHEGPDARERRPNMKPMTEGYTIDHFDPHGKPILITLFSAPNYPELNGRGNAAAVMKVGPDLIPAFVQYQAVDHPPSQFAMDDDDMIGNDSDMEVEGDDDDDDDE